MTHLFQNQTNHRIWSTVLVTLCFIGHSIAASADSTVAAEGSDPPQFVITKLPRAKKAKSFKATVLTGIDRQTLRRIPVVELDLSDFLDAQFAYPLDVTDIEVNGYVDKKESYIAMANTKTDITDSNDSDEQKHLKPGSDKDDVVAGGSTNQTESPVATAVANDHSKTNLLDAGSENRKKNDKQIDTGGWKIDDHKTLLTTHSAKDPLQPEIVAVERDPAKPGSVFLFFNPATVHANEDIWVGFRYHNSRENKYVVLFPPPDKDDNDQARVTIPDLGAQSKWGNVTLADASVQLLPESGDTGIKSAQTLTPPNAPPLTPPSGLPTVSTVTVAGDTKKTNVRELKLSKTSAEGVRFFSNSGMRADAFIEALVSDTTRDPNGLITVGMTLNRSLLAIWPSMLAHNPRYTAVHGEEGATWIPISATAEIPQNVFSRHATKTVTNSNGESVPVASNDLWYKVDVGALGLKASGDVRQLPGRFWDFIQGVPVRGTQAPDKAWPGTATFTFTPLNMSFDHSRRTLFTPTTLDGSADNAGGSVLLTPTGWHPIFGKFEARWDTPLFNTGANLSASYNYEFFYTNRQDTIMTYLLNSKKAIPVDLPTFGKSVNFAEIAISIPGALGKGVLGLTGLNFGYRSGFVPGQSYYDPFAINRNTVFIEASN